MRVLQVLPSLSASAGGTAEGVIQQSLALMKLGHTVHVVTLDSPAVSIASGLPESAVSLLGPARYKYGYCSRLRSWLDFHGQSFDVMVIHGLWQYPGLCASRAARRSRIPYVVYLHGMLDPWFKQTYPLKHLKKVAYWLLFERHVLRHARLVLSTTQEEQLRARHSFPLYSAREAVVGFGIHGRPASETYDRNAVFEAYPDLSGKRVLLFLARLHAKKGCDLLIRAFAEVAARDERLRLVIAGPDDGDVRVELEQLARASAMAERILFLGLVEGDLKWSALENAEALALPSHQENFGVAVAESLASSVPVLISDKVNISREVAACGAGLVEPDTQAGTTRLLKRWLDLPAAERLGMRAKARACFEHHFSAERVYETLAISLESCCRA